MNFQSKILLLILAIASFAHAEQISFSADSMTGTAGNKDSVTVLKGRANVKTQSMEISADSIELSGKDFRYIKAQGNVTGKNTESKMDFSCQKLSYDRETKIALLEENVDLVDVENEVAAKAQVIEYNQDKEIAVMQINVDITQKENHCTCAYAIYRKGEQLLEMSGNPRIVQSGDTFRAQIIVLDMDTQEITLTGRVQGSVSTEESKSQASSSANSDEAQIQENAQELKTEQSEQENFSQQEQEQTVQSAEEENGNGQ